MSFIIKHKKTLKRALWFVGLYLSGIVTLALSHYLLKVTVFCLASS